MIDQVLIIRPTEARKKSLLKTTPDGKDHLVYSIKSPTFTTIDYGLTFNLYPNLIGDTSVIVRQDTNTESEILRIPGNRRQK